MGDGDLLFGEDAEPPDLAPLLALDGVSMPLLMAAQPSGYGDALDTRGRPLRWLAAEAWLEGYTPVNLRAAEEKKSVAGMLASDWREGGGLPARARRYQQLVENFSRRYNLSAELVYAIIHSESDFSPGLDQRQVGHGPHAASAQHSQRRGAPFPLWPSRRGEFQRTACA